LFRILLLLFIVVPTIEIFVLIQVGKVIGGWQTVFLILLTGVLGAYLAKKQGQAAWFRLQTELAMGRPPGNTILDGICILIGGILLLTPGFVTDVFGLVFLLPPTREPLKIIIKKWIEKQMTKGTWISFRRW
jgi:UPF0716 protein FxsA